MPRPRAALESSRRPRAAPGHRLRDWWGRLGRPPFTPWLGVNTYVYVVIGGAKLPASSTLLTERLKYMPRLVKVQSCKDANIRDIP